MHTYVIIYNGFALFNALKSDLIRLFRIRNSKFLRTSLWKSYYNHNVRVHETNATSRIDFYQIK